MTSMQNWYRRRKRMHKWTESLWRFPKYLSSSEGLHFPTCCSIKEKKPVPPGSSNGFQVELGMALSGYFASYGHWKAITASTLNSNQTSKFQKLQSYRSSRACITMTGRLSTLCMYIASERFIAKLHGNMLNKYLKLLTPCSKISRVKMT